MIARRVPSPLWFVLPLAGIFLAALGVAAMVPHSGEPALVSAALTIDLVVAVPLLYYRVLVRGRGWPAITLAPVFFASIVAARFLVPASHQDLLSRFEYVLPVIEVGVVGYVVHRVRRSLKLAHPPGRNDVDFLERARAVATDVVHSSVAAAVLAFEVSIFYYALSATRFVTPEHGFSYHRRSGYGAVVVAVLMVALTEFVALHVLIRSWSGTAAVVHAILACYGIVWLVGDYRAQRRRPHILLRDSLSIRLGLRWTVNAQWNRVAAVRRAHSSGSADIDLKAVPVGRPGYVVEFNDPVVATGLYGIHRRVRSVGFSVDDAAAFEDRLRSIGIHLET